MNRRVLLAMLLALAVPGAGHFYLGRRARGLAFFAIVTTLFATGLAVGGSLYTLAETRGEFFARLGSLVSFGSGLLYVVGFVTGPHGSISLATFEYGRTFTLTASLMNLLLVLDCRDLALATQVKTAPERVFAEEASHDDLEITDREFLP